MALTMTSIADDLAAASKVGAPLTARWSALTIAT